MARAGLADRGVRAALLSAVLFGAGTPVAKLLLGEVSPWLLAGLLYCGSGVGLTVIRLLRRAPTVHLPAREWLLLAGAIGVGGVLAPVLLLLGLAAMPASGVSLLLNAEAVFTAVLAWVAFRENVDPRIVLGMLAIVAGAIMLSVPSGAQFGTPWPALLVLGACCCWGLDNNLTRALSLNDADWLAATKGIVAGPVNLGLALLLGARLPDIAHLGGALITGFVAYGVSLTLFVVALRHLGTARAGAYYSVAPFFGALLAVVLGAPITVPLVVAALLMGVGVGLHLTERHEHEHTHGGVTHTHPHYPDAFHRHH